MTTKIPPVTQLFELAEHNRQMMEHYLSQLNRPLRDLLEDPDASISYVPGDGWCLLFSGDRLAPLSLVSIEALLSMTKEEAIEELLHHAI